MSQHVAPVICLAAGTGLSALIGRLRTVALQKRALNWAGTLFVAIGLGCMLIDVLYPYRGDCDVWMRAIVRHIADLCGPNDQIVVLNNETEVDVVFRWELARFREQGGLLGWSGNLDLARASDRSGQVWLLKMSGSPRGFESIRPLLEQTHRTWVLSNQIPYTILPRKKRDPVLHCEVRRWVCPGTPGLPADLSAVSCWPIPLTR